MSSTVSHSGPSATLTAPEMEISAADQEVRFQITTDKASPTGQQKSLFCQVTVMKNGEPIVHKYPDSTVAQAYQALARSVQQALEQGAPPKELPDVQL